MKSPVFALALSPEDDSFFDRLFKTRPQFEVWSSLSEPAAGLSLQSKFAGAQERLALLGPLCRSAPMPSEWKWAEAMIQTKPQTVGQWSTRAMLLMALTGNAVYVADEVATKNLDLMTFLTAARMLKLLTIGFIPATLRAPLDSTVLSMTDIVAGEAEPRALSLLVQNLDVGLGPQEQTTDGDQKAG